MNSSPPSPSLFDAFYTKVQINIYHEKLQYKLRILSGFVQILRTKKFH